VDALVNVAGIDVGQTVALALISAQDGFLSVHDLPVHRLAVGKKIRTELDLASLWLILAMNLIRPVVIERVGLRPGEDLSSIFNFGHSAGSFTA
jgi:hypothetical protein